MHPSIYSIPLDFLARFQLTPLLSFRDPATEQLYQRSATTAHALVRILPLALAAVACGWSWEGGLLALGIADGVAVWLALECRDILSVCLTFMSLRCIDPGGFSPLTPFSLCVLGTIYIGLFTPWRQLAGLYLVNFVFCLYIGSSAPLLSWAGAILLLFFLQKHKRELWVRVEAATVSEKHISELVATQEFGVVLSEFSGRILYRNPAAERYLQLCADGNMLKSDTFGEGLKDTTEVEREIRLDVGEEMAGAVARVRRVPWFGRNVVLVTFVETSEWVRTIVALTKVDTKVLNEVSTLERDANRRFRDTSDLSAQLDLCRLHTVLHEVNSSLAFQRAIVGRYEGLNSGFNLRTEMVDTVELASAAAETKGLNVTLTFEPGVPSAVTSDKVAVNSVLRFAYSRLVEESSRGEQVGIRVRVSSAGGNSVKVSVGLELVTKGKGGLVRELKEASTTSPSDLETSAFLTFLHSLHGDYFCDSSSSDPSLTRLSLHYDMALQPEAKSEGRFQLPIVSHFRQDLSGDKWKWDYTGGLGRNEVVRKRYVKQNSRKSARGLTTIETTHAVLLPIAETYSSEQLSEDRGFPEAAVCLESVVSEEDAPSRPPPPRHPFPSDSSLDVPNELEGSSPLCRTLTRNHNDLRKVSSSRTTSPGSSPFNSSFRAL